MGSDFRQLFLFATVVIMSAVNTSVLAHEDVVSSPASCDNRPCEDYDQFVYNPHIIINPPRFSVAAVQAACCNCSTVRRVVADEMAKLAETYRTLRDETKSQLQQLQTAMSDLAQMLQNLPAAKPTVLLPVQELNRSPETTMKSSPRPPDEAELTTVSTTAEPTTPPPPPPPPTTLPNEPSTLPPETTIVTTVSPTPEPSTPSPETTPSYETTVLPTTNKTLPPLPKVIDGDCSEASAAGVTTSGVYMVRPRDSGPLIRVYCDMDTDGGGWTVFQRRRDGRVDFYRDYEAYSKGFGNPDDEFWLGNDNLHRLTAQGARVYELRVDLDDFEDNSVHAVYRSFGVSSAENGYMLTVGTYSGTAGDSLSRHNQKPFTTKDRDNDDFLRGNCAQLYHGAWWYERCHQSNLNGNYLRGSNDNYAQGVVWRRWKGYNYSLKTSEMKFRKKFGVAPNGRR